MLDDYPEYLAEFEAIVGVPERAATIDYLIGERALVGHGLGTRMIRSVLEKTWRDLEQASSVMVAVVSANPASWRALEKTGLVRVASGDMTPDNPIDDPPHHIYRIDREPAH
jgi:aminoglycoside 6'-N-acetyltransferase